ncbi:MAG TPA: histidine phosphatase family protein [Solirubrobacteraceae bacterium]|nr:histidine phosphatase family protein [Solirubrobacteraceae bacterium]
MAETGPRQAADVAPALDLRGILLARHGETDDNREPIRVQGFRDTPLNDTGRAQAAALAERVRDAGIASLWSSDLARARVTAEIVGERLGLETRTDERLREAHRGRWEGRLFIEIAEEEPEGYAAWRRAGASFRFPGGESLLEQQQRVTAALCDIHARSPLPALVVCHGGSIRVMLCRGHPRGLEAFHDFEVPNTAVVPM